MVSPSDNDRLALPVFEPFALCTSRTKRSARSLRDSRDRFEEADEQDGEAGFADATVRTEPAEGSFGGDAARRASIAITLDECGRRRGGARLACGAQR